MGPAQPRLETPVQYLRGVGPARAHQLARLGIERLDDLLHHYPTGYLDRGAVVGVGQLAEGDRSLTRGQVLDVQTRRIRGRRSMVTAVLGDGGQRLQLVWFNAAWVARSLHVGETLVVFGTVARYHGRLQMTNPEFDRDGASEDLSQGKLVPRYPATAGLTQGQIRKLVAGALEAVGEAVEDPLPPAWRQRLELPDRRQAVRDLHEPGDIEQADRARRRLAFDEAVALQLAVGLRRARLHRRRARLPVGELGDLSARFVAGLGFALTRAQRRVLAEIRRDLRGPQAMHRLLHGDVGAGKTAVAVIAMLWIAEAGGQAAFLAPTEVLARQHGERLLPRLAKLGIRGEILTAATPTPQRSSILGGLARGEIQLVFGTHALLARQVRFARLGLAVVDEQHRFGVDQRGALAQEGAHLLVMSATPIPRSLALTVYGDLDLSVLDEVPPGRTPVETAVVGPGAWTELLARVAAAAARGEQAFLVFPRLEDGAAEGAAGLSAEAAFEELTAGPLADVRVGLLHGRLPAATKAAVAGAFAKGELDVLVATTVVEVGIDVPAATWMVVQQAERFGLAQLHQLRGRVGRGDQPGRCVLVLGKDAPPEARPRLQQVAAIRDGLRLAEMDLKERGMGDLFGRRQHGAASLRLLEPSRDAEILDVARELARDVVATDPHLKRSEHRSLATWLQDLGQRDPFWSSAG